jgi:hypothetical protein
MNVKGLSPPIHLSINPSINPSIDRSIHPFIDPSIYHPTFSRDNAQFRIEFFDLPPLRIDLAIRALAKVDECRGASSDYEIGARLLEMELESGPELVGSSLHLVVPLDNINSYSYT